MSDGMSDNYGSGSNSDSIRSKFKEQNDSKNILETKIEKYTNKSYKIKKIAHIAAFSMAALSTAYLINSFNKMPKAPQEYTIAQKSYDSISSIVHSYDKLPEEARVPQFSQKIHNEMNELETRITEIKNTPEYKTYDTSINKHGKKLIYGLIGLFPISLAILVSGLITGEYYTIKRNTAKKNLKALSKQRTGM